VSGADLLHLGAEHGLRIDEVMLANECAWRSEVEVRNGIRHIWSVMRECMRAGLNTEGELPGGLHVRRRAPSLYKRLCEGLSAGPFSAMDWLNVFAIGVNEENAAISGAEVGCQGEVGVACSMAAGELAAALGGANEQVEHAAEIAMEHNLGMTWMFRGRCFGMFRGQATKPRNS
jgi:L-serine dehydratase